MQAATMQAAPQRPNLGLEAVPGQHGIATDDSRVQAWLTECLRQQLLGSRLHLLTQRDAAFLHAWFEP